MSLLSPRQRLGAHTACLLVYGLLCASVLRAPATHASDPTGEVPLADVLEIVVLENKILAIDAHGGGQTHVALEIGERVHWTGTQGRVGIVLTDRRLLAIGTGSAAWQVTRYRRNEEPPPEALLGERVAVIATSKRALGFDGGSGNLVERSLGPRETVWDEKAGANVAVIVTNRRALGLSPFAGGFFEAKLRLGEALQSLKVRANLATLTTSQRILIFRAPSGSWEERALDLQR